MGKHWHEGQVQEGANPPTATGIVVAIQPANAEIVQDAIHTQSSKYSWKTQRFLATVTGDPGNNGVTWNIEQGAGTISPEGVYTPPVDTRPGKATISATSVTDKKTVAYATVTYRYAA